MQRVKISTICIAMGGFALILLFIQTFLTKNDYSLCQEKRITRIANEDSEMQHFFKSIYSSNNYEKTIEQARLKIEHEIGNYNFTLSGVRGLNDLLIDRGGQQIRSIIVSTWRSGSTFLGEILKVMPGSFYTYEPLTNFYGGHRVRLESTGKEAVRIIKNLLKCNYEDFDEYFRKKLLSTVQFEPNKRLWDICTEQKDLCSQTNFIEELCKLCPFQSMKLIRLGLSLIRDVLQDEKLKVRVAFLVRDPRAVLNSRLGLTFCRDYFECRTPEVLCGDMVNDYNAARELMKQYPDTFRVLRFEELALNPKETVHQLYNFFKLGDLQAVDRFLDEHTNTKILEPFAVYRVSHEVPFKWKKQLNYSYVDKIQTICEEAMYLWGYRKTYNESHMRSIQFFSLDQYTL